MAILESTGSKGLVQVNGTAVKKNSSCTLSSGDEIVFGMLGNHAYVSLSFISCLSKSFGSGVLVPKLCHLHGYCIMSSQKL